MEDQSDKNNPKQGIGRRIGRNTVWVAAGRFSDILAVVLVNMLLARWLAPDDFKSFLVLFNLVSLLSICGTLGVNRSIVRFLSESLAMQSPDRAQSALHSGGRMVLAGSAIFAVAMAVLSVPFAKEKATPLLVGSLCFAVILRALQRFLSESLRGYHEVRLASLFAGQNAGQACGPFTDFLFLASIAVAYNWLAPSLATSALLYVLALLVSLPLAIRLLVGVVSRSLQEREVGSYGGGPLVTRELVWVSVGTLLTQVFIFTTWHSDLWLADFFLTSDAGAQYAVARNLLLIIMLPLALINLAVISTIPELYSQRKLDKLQRVLQTAAGFSAVPSLIAVVVLAFGGRSILSLVFGEFYGDGAAILTVLACGRVASAFCGAGGFALMMTGYERVYLLISLAATIILWIGGPMAATRWGPLGLASVAAAVFFVYHATILLAVRQCIGIWTYPTLPWLRVRPANQTELVQ